MPTNAESMSIASLLKRLESKDAEIERLRSKGERMAEALRRVRDNTEECSGNAHDGGPCDNVIATLRCYHCDARAALAEWEGTKCARCGGSGKIPWACATQYGHERHADPCPDCTKGGERG